MDMLVIDTTVCNNRSMHGDTMSTPRRLTIAQLLDAGHCDLGCSSWRVVTADNVASFHRAIELVSPAGNGRIEGAVPGDLLVSTIPMLMFELLEVTDKRSGLNYGMEEMQHGSPIPVGSAVRMRASLVNAVAVRDGARYSVDVAFEVRLTDGTIRTDGLHAVVTYVALP